VFYGLTSWLAVGGVGVADVRARSTSELGELFFNLTTQYTAEWVTGIMALLLLTSVLASIIALHNATSRYLFALGREALLPRWLGATHPRFHSPPRASATQSVLALAGLGIAIVLVLRYYAYITGTSSVFVDDLPVLIPVAAAAGVGRALWLRARQPEAYHALGHTESAPGPTPAVDDAPSAVHS